MAGDEAEATGSVGEFGNEIGRGVAAVRLGPRDGGKGLGQEAVSREDSDRFPVDPVVGRATATEMIIVHAGKIVVNEGVSVNAFDGAGGREGIRLFATDGTSRRQAEDGAQTFSSGQQAVAHGAVNEGRIGLGGDEAIERFFDQGEAGFPKCFGVHQGKI